MAQAPVSKIAPHQIALLLTTGSALQDHAASPAGKALHRLSSRFARRAQGTLPAHEQAHKVQTPMGQLLCEAQQGRLTGVVWLREDVVVDDYNLDQRLNEAWQQQDMVTLHDEQQQVVLWAVGAKGLRRLQALPERFDAEAGAGDRFPNGMRQCLQRLGLSDGPWPLALSLLRPGLPAMPLPPQGWNPATAPPLVIACATRESEDRFETHTPTGRSLARLRQAGFRVHAEVAARNRAALAKAYNVAVREELADHIVVFMHDDVWIDDLYLPQRLHEALGQYDVVGVAGGRNRIAGQPAWCFPTRLGEWDLRDNLLGTVAHEVKPKKSAEPSPVSRYGFARGPARLLDGLLIATRVASLLERGVRFDERFPFHFYDLDFCRTAEARGLRLGVWPLSVTHHSPGDGFGNAAWMACWGRYIGKWGH